MLAAVISSAVRGEKPADLPVQLPIKFEGTLHVKTAKSLGRTVPQSILLSADKAIEYRLEAMLWRARCCGRCVREWGSVVVCCCG